MPDSILISASQVIITLLGVYLLARIKEDAKNKSLLDHIADLTKKTEEVKRGFNEDLEHVRKGLEILVNRRNVLFEESKNAIIEFLSNITNWIHDLNGGIFEYNLLNFESIDDRVQAIDRDYQLVNNSSSRVQLIVDDDEINKASSDTVLALMEIHF